MSTSEPSPTPAPRDNAAIVMHVLQSLVRREIDAVREYIARDIVYHLHAYQKTVRGADEFIAFLDGYYGRVDDFRSEVNHVVTAGDLVALEGRETYVMGGQRVEFPYASWARLEGGRIVEWSDYFDSRIVGKQLKGPAAQAP